MSTQHILTIVALEECFCRIPTFPALAPGSFVLQTYHTTPRTDDLELLRQRIHDADILLITTFPFTARTLSEDFSPKLRLIVIMSVGTDSVDLEACRKRDITVMNCPQVNSESVAEHAMMLYLSSRRKLIQLHSATVRDEWVRQGTLIKSLDDHAGNAPLSWQDEIVGIVGYGAVGQRIATICRSLGMNLIISERVKPPNGTDDRKPTENGRTSFTELLKTATVIFLSLPRTSQTLGLISTAQFSTMQTSALLINVSRGGIVDERALLQALKENRIAGAACDVFETEPASRENSVLLRFLAEDALAAKLPLIVTPHVAWCSNATTQGLQKMTRENVEGWLKGRPDPIRIVA